MKIKCLAVGVIIMQLLAVMLVSCNPKKNSTIKQAALDTLKNTENINPYAPADQSPMDMCYYPENYPILRMNGTDNAPLLARVIYSRPQKKARLIFGYTSKSLREYGKDWRLGANEATEIEFFKDVIIGEKKIEKGRYVIYCIPYPEKWTIILNNNLFTWGLHIDKTRDIFKTDIPVSLQSPVLEDFTMIFKPALYGTDLVMAWDNVKAVLPIKTTAAN